MKGLIIFIQLFVLGLHISANANGIIYSWMDEQGKRHFSDQPSQDIHSEVFEGDQLVTIKTIPLKPKFNRSNYKQKASNRQKQSMSNKQSRCSSIRKKIVNLEKKLDMKLTADKFDTYKQQLSQFRWKKIKHC